jgi:SAM-dependent methyltransferase
MSLEHAGADKPAAGPQRAPGELAFLDRNYSAATLVKALARKVRRRIFGAPNEIEPAHRVGYVVFDRRDLDGGGAGFGQDYIPVLRELGLNHTGRLFEFCAGPGYIGYSLLAHGFCSHLTLADINPVAVAAARETAAFNGLADSVSIYQSDGLDDIPATEKWDLVVSNPPHFPDGNPDLRLLDTEWKLHKRFYSQIKRFMNPGGQLVIQENAQGSKPDDFIPMIRDGGGEYIKTLPGPDIGPGGRMYYLVSRWNA